MINLDGAYAGPEFSKKEKMNPAHVIVSLIDQNPAATREQLEKEYLEMAREDQELADANAKLAFLYAYNNIQGYTRRRKDSGFSGARREAVEAEARQIIEKIKSVIVMDIVLPSGKTVRRSTGAECKAAGGLFLRIAAKVKPNQVVGKVLTEEQAQKLWAQKR